MRNKSNVRKRLNILSNAIGDVYGKRLSSFYSEIRDMGEICFMPHPLLSITITISKVTASVVVKESECVSKPGTIKSIRDFNRSGVLDICQFVEENVIELMAKLGEEQQIKPIVNTVKRTWLAAWMKRLGFMDWWEGAK